MYSLLLGFTVFAFPESYSKLLNKHVDKNGCVRYEDWRDDPLYKQLLRELPRHAKPRNDTAYWINTYNALTVHVIVENLPIKSIRDIDNGTVWSTQKFILSDGLFTLDDIEHKILRPKKDPRVHAALSCASLGCPPLWNNAYSEIKINAQLDRAMERWLDHNAYHEIDGVVKISKVFLWYSEDFDNNPIQFLKKIRPNVRWTPWKQTQFIEYDWSLNKAN